MTTVKNTPSTQAARSRDDIAPARTSSASEAKEAAALAEKHPPVDADGFEMSRPDLRAPVDRRDADLPEGDAALQDEVSALRVAPGHRGGGDNGVGNGLNRAGGNLRSARGRIPSSSWDHPERIVGRLTQNPARGRTGNSAYRCAPANLLASSLMNGPESAARFMERSASAAGSRLSVAERSELNGIARDVRGRSATFDQLNRAQDLLYKAGNTRVGLQSAVTGVLNDRTQRGRLSAAERTELGGFETAMRRGSPVTEPQARRMEALLRKAHADNNVSVGLVRDEHHPNDASREYYSVTVGGTTAGRDRSGFDDRELQSLATSGGGTPRHETVRIDVSHPMEDMLTRLKAGESATFRVAGRNPGKDGDPGPPDHFITIGRRPNGQAYVYNSDPDRGDHTLFTGARGNNQPGNFVSELRRYDARISFDADSDQPNTVVSSFP